MRTWGPASHTMTCGACGRFIEPGQALLTLTLVFAKTPPITLWRCGKCETAPPDLPERVEVQTREQASVRAAADVVFRRIHRRHLEEHAPLLVEREPGEEG